MSRYHEEYGLPERTLEEEIALPKTMKDTEHNKINMISMCNCMRRELDTIEYRARYAPVKDDEWHSGLVAKMAALVREAERAVHRAALYNGDD